MSNQSKKILALGVAIVVGFTIYVVVRAGLRQIIPDSSGFRILVGAIAGGVGAGLGSLIFTNVVGKLDGQEPSE